MFCKYIAMLKLYSAQKLGHKLLYEGGRRKKGGKRGEKKGGRKKADICNG